MQRDNVAFSKFSAIGGFAALFGLIALGVGFATDRTATMQAYLFGWVFWTLLVLGCLGLTILHHTIRGSWGLSVLRMLEAGGGVVALGVSAILMVPILLFMPEVFPWMAGENMHDHIVHAKSWYLNQPFFIGRQVLYFLIWILMASVLRRSSLKQDETLDPSLGVRRQSVGAVGLVIFFVTMTFAVTDWIMSLELAWYSSILPMLTAVGCGLTALSLCVIILLANRHKEPFASIITPQLTKDLGNMLFALTMLWQYMTLSQFLITWSGNLQEEIPYYLKRNDAGWTILITSNILFQFFVPFTALLAPRTKRVARNLLIVAVLIFVMRFGDMYWTIMPSMRGGRLLDSLGHWQDYVAWFALGGVWLAVLGSQIAQAAVLPKHDTRLLEVEHAH
jgi:hypothetical protein